MIFIESKNDERIKKFIRRISEPNGHDCWGNSEFYTYEVVYIDKNPHRIDNEMYIMHDNKEVIAVGYLSSLPDRVGNYLDPRLKEKRKRERYERFLLYQKEFSIDSEENTKIKRDVSIDTIIRRK